MVEMHVLVCSMGVATVVAFLRLYDGAMDVSMVIPLKGGWWLFKDVCDGSNYVREGRCNWGWCDLSLFGYLNVTWNELVKLEPSKIKCDGPRWMSW